MSISKDSQLQNKSVNPNLVVNTLFALKVNFHSKMLEADALWGLCKENILQGNSVERLGKQSRAGSNCSLAPPKISIDNNKAK